MKYDLPGQTAFENYLAQFCAPISWLPKLGSPATSLTTNGTCALVDTGKTKVLVTCHHVWAGWMKFKQRNPGAELWLGLDDGVPLDLTDAPLVASDEGLDLAIIKANVDSAQLRTKAFCQIQEWPIPDPKVGDVVAIMGFPGTRRTPIGEQVTMWSAEFLGYRVSAVSPRNITLAPERRDRIRYDENWKEIAHDDIGGMSGSPAFVLRDVGLPSLVGFLYEGANSDDFIFLTPASYLQPDGTLRA